MAKPSGQVSEKRHRVVLDGDRWGAIVRPINYEEALKFGAKVESHRYQACLDVAESTIVEDLKLKGKPLTPAAKASIGLQVLIVSGDGATAREVSSDDLGDEAGAVYVANESRDLICLRLEDRHFERTDLLFLEPDPGRFESYAAAKHKGGGLDTDRDFVRQHLLREMQGHLETLEREAPAAIAALARELAKIGGVVFEAHLGKA